MRYFKSTTTSENNRTQKYENLDEDKINELRQSEYLNCSFFSYLFFSWVTGIVNIGSKQPFEQHMHAKFRVEEQSETNYHKYNEIWRRVKHKRLPLLRTIATAMGGSHELYGTYSHIFLRLLLGMFLKGLCINVTTRILSLTGPMLMSRIIKFVQNPEADFVEGIILIILIGLSKLSWGCSWAHSRFYHRRAGWKNYAAINSLIYQKTLKYSILKSTDQSVGKMVNLMQVDTQKTILVINQTSLVLSLTVQIAVGVVLVYNFIGISFLAGLVAILIGGLLNVQLGRKYQKYQHLMMEKKDDRMKLTNEIMNGIKYIKMSGSEEYFLQKGDVKRTSELRVLKKEFIVELLQNFSNWLVPMLITVLVFTTYVLLGNQLTAAVAFPVVLTLMALQQPLRSLPENITELLDCYVGIKRIQDFLLAEEINTDCIKHNDKNTPNIAIKIENGNFYWVETNKEKPETNDVSRNNGDEEKTEKGYAQMESFSSRDESKQKATPDQNQNIQLRLIEAKSPVRDLSKSETENEESKNKNVDLESPDNFESVKNPTESTLMDEKDEGSTQNYILKDINLEIQKGSFVAIIGDVGSGKSSLFYSLFGEMKYHESNPPAITINGSLAYISQKPWILNDTVKNNILFGAPFDEQKYQDAVKNSCLESDLSILPNGDETEIGEKGVNLSGGQKARVSLAQAVYADRDIYLLDDPLSTVDVHVGTFIIQECLSKYLKDKTRIMITHNLDYLKYVDYIYVMEKGQIVDQGSYDQIITHDIYTQLLQKYHTEQEEEKKSREDLEEVDASDKKQLEEIQLVKEKSQDKSSEKDKQEIVEKVDNEDKTADIPPNSILAKLIMTEDRRTGKVDFDVYKAFIKFYGGFRFAVLILIFMSGWTGVSLGSNFYLSHWTNANKNNQNNTNAGNQFDYLTIYAFLSVACTLVTTVISAIIFLRSLQCSKTLHNLMLKSIIRAPINLFFDRVPIGRILNRFSKDLDITDKTLGFSFYSFLTDFFCLVGDVVICMYGSSFYLFPLVVFFVSVSYQLQKRYQTLNRELVRLESISKSPVLSHYSQSINGLTTIRGYGVQQRFFSSHLHNLDENLKNLLLIQGSWNWFSFRTSLVSLLLIIPTIFVSVNILGFLLVNVSMTHKLIFKDTVSAHGSLIGLVLTYAFNIDEDIRWALASQVIFENNLISVERCLGFVEVEPEATENTNLRVVPSFSPKWPDQGQIELVNYSVRYRPSLPLVLKNISINIAPKEKIGIVGRTGSGKSTIILSLLRVLEASSGKIIIDGIDISKLGLYDLRKRITVIPQDPHLFDGTLRENIDFANEYSDSKIWEVLEQVSLKEKFLEKEHGLLTMIKDEGGNLSAGERQLVCIARAILRGNKIILIDEATSNIDVKTEALLQKTIREELVDCTVLTIAHRLKTIIDSDRILVMGNGEVLEFDTPRKLLDNPHSYFFKLWEKAKNEQLFE